MKSKGLTKVDLIFESIDAKEGAGESLLDDPGRNHKQVLESGLKGRGGAGFPTGMKWKFTAAEKDPRNI
jgi:[NiFe] hydrogenase diaphorase moiety large subunit